MVTWWTAASYDPPRMVFSLAPERFTYRLILESKKFGVSAVSIDHIQKLLYLGDFSSRFVRNKVERSGFTISRGSVLGAPLIEEAYASAELELWKVIDVGDHDLVVGEVRAVYGLPSFDGVWKIEESKPILYLGRLRATELKRAYVNLENAKTAVVEVKYEKDLEEARELRRRLMDEVLSAVETSEAEEKTMKRIAEIASRYGLSSGDVPYLLKEALKRLKITSRIPR
ncbi:MAG: flavin reductase family protein [Acidilobaceae archaeon]